MPDGSLGTLEAGKIADMVIVKGDPLEQISVLQDADAITAVIKDGQIYAGLLDSQSPHQKNSEQLNQLLGAPPCN